MLHRHKHTKQHQCLLEDRRYFQRFLLLLGDLNPIRLIYSLTVPTIRQELTTIFVLYII